jgi:NADH-quinone oxidoreductase subunit J
MLFLQASPPLLPIALPVAVGALAIFLLLPRPRPYPRLWGAAAAALALLLTGWLLVHASLSRAETVLFYAFSAVAIVAGGSLVTQRNPAYAALSFALVVLSTCGLFLIEAAPFLMAATIVIYAGAIIVTFLFVLMLAHTEGPDDANDRSREPLLATIAGFVMLGALLYVLAASFEPGSRESLASNLQPIDEYLQRVRQAEQAEPNRAGRQLIADATVALETYDSSTKAALFDLLYEDGILKKWDEGQRLGGAAGAQKMKDALVDLDREVTKVRNSLWSRSGGLQPGRNDPLSEFSGPSPAGEVRRDVRGSAVLPAENVASLGRSLFTDYLLAVELAGTLLLVASIGAIAIASRAGERLR